MFRRRSFVFVTLFSLAVIQLMMWGVYLNRSVFPPQVPLYYFRSWGESRLADPQQLWLIPCLAGGVFVVNTSLAWVMYRKNPDYSRFLVFSSALVSFLGLVFLLNIFSLVLP